MSRSSRIFGFVVAAALGLAAIQTLDKAFRLVYERVVGRRIESRIYSMLFYVVLLLALAWGVVEVFDVELGALIGGRGG